MEEDGLKLKLGNNEHLVIRKYLSDNSLVESNLTSFNNFIERRMQEIVNEISDNIESDDIEIKLGKIRIDKPNVIESDGATNLLTPAEARLRNLTYSAPVFLEISIKQDGGQIETQEVEIGRIPIMVKSKACNVYNMSKEELENNYMDPYDFGGYFIVNGNERIMIMTEDLAANQPFIEENSKDRLILRLFSARGAYRIPVTIAESTDGILEVSFSRFKNIPAVVLLKALGLLKKTSKIPSVDSAIVTGIL